MTYNELIGTLNHTHSLTPSLTHLLTFYYRVIRLRDSILTNPVTSFEMIIRRWLQLRFDCDSTALRPFDDLRHDRAAALRPT